MKNLTQLPMKHSSPVNIPSPEIVSVSPEMAALAASLSMEPRVIAALVDIIFSGEDAQIEN